MKFDGILISNFRDIFSLKFGSQTFETFFSLKFGSEPKDIALESGTSEHTVREFSTKFTASNVQVTIVQTWITTMVDFTACNRGLIKFTSRGANKSIRFLSFKVQKPRVFRFITENGMCNVVGGRR